ncbi:IS4 family transposase [Carboxydothermus islandicus]|uniref:IS4 family transposase n=1 Tax=Carboxydothermus islandicus TaxID=661089 RepID=A0A1L8D133_9THEO|nr:IS1634 family transposase [Carboxydothermus islandicus]GAV24905.1 IS4 family transposase [Carboxydothermus islandicus]
MHLKVVKAGNYEYVRLVEAYRENGKVKHKVILNLGRKDLIEGNPSFKRLAERLAEIANGSSTLKISGEAQFSEGTLRNYGFIVYRKLWQLFELNKFFADLANHPRLQFDLNSACFLMAVQHLLSPKSKLATYLNREQYLGIPEIDLNHLYRSLDLLAENKELIENYVFEKNCSLFNMNVDVVFYDVTTFHFESVRNDELRDFGFSKDNKINEVQVVMGLLIDNEGRPIGYELFPGNTLDSKTLAKSLEKLQKRFNIRQVVIVADRGLNSKLNLKYIKDLGYDYIVATRLKKMPQSVLAEVFNPEGYETLKMANPFSEEENLDDFEQFRYKVLDHINRIKDEKGVVYELPEKLVITYSAKRALKDEEDRKRLIEKAEKLLLEPAKIKASNKRGGKKFIKHQSENDQFFLDEEAIEKDKRFDGYYAIQSSRLDLDAKKVLEAYHTLWKIEESFRIMKSTLEVRPIFHWTEKRIKGHFVVCFLAFLLERTLEFRLKENRVEVSPQKIQEALNSLTFTEVEINGQKLLIKMRPTEVANKILRILRIAPPKNMMPLEDAKEFTW